ncbi:DNA glycosylase [Schizopora paradoxa]|uniref:DNA glycosylase n=1 Tax=Schizopora paradoxa TaxID=27342 RepID=A0A0H2S6D6_9AGAM|nr:DNA glycosylase [Schizopora paradoxa]
MPVTRSSSRSSSLRNASQAASATATPKPSASRKSSKASSVKRTTSKTKPEDGDGEATQVESSTQIPVPADLSELYSAPTFLPTVLSFSLEDAKKHLIEADPRFEDIFDRLQCRPFEELERVDPFRTLASSILGQQISWLAAKSITHRFIRLFNPSLPEKPTDFSPENKDQFFPSARQVLTMDIATLRTAGLSGRKAEYSRMIVFFPEKKAAESSFPEVLDLAAKFSDGSLSTEKIFQANDEELAEMLIAVRGIGRWTVDMFAMFSLRRPDILPLGDLGVQRGIARWFLSLHSPQHPIMISPKKLPDNQKEGNKNEESQQNIEIKTNGQASQSDVQMDDPSTQESTQNSQRATTPDISSLPPIPLSADPVTPIRGGRSIQGADVDDEASARMDIAAPPPAFTPSINRTLNKPLPPQYTAAPLPAGLTIPELKTRLTGKKKIKGAMLTPQEMEELTQSWKPYRSIGVYYMWALAEGEKA